MKFNRFELTNLVYDFDTKKDMDRFIDFMEVFDKLGIMGYDYFHYCKDIAERQLIFNQTEIDV